MTSLSDRIREAVQARAEIARGTRPLTDETLSKLPLDMINHLQANGPDVVLRQCDADLKLLDFAEAKQDGPSRRAILHYLRCAYGVSDA